MERSQRSGAYSLLTPKNRENKKELKPNLFARATSHSKARYRANKKFTELYRVAFSKLAVPPKRSESSSAELDPADKYSP